MSQTIIKNAYDFSDTLTMPTSQIEQTIAFSSNNTAFSGIRITTDTMYFVQSSGTEVEVYNTSTKWSTTSKEYQKIAIDTNVLVSDTFGTWFSNNAVRGAYSLTITYGGATYTVGGGGGSIGIASADKLGGIKTGYSTSGKNYKVQVDTDGNAYVNVPWESGSYTLPTASAYTLGGVKIGSGIKISNGVISVDDSYLEPFLLSKGDLITMNLGNTTSAYGTLHQYRIMRRISGSKYLVVAMYEPTTSQTFGSSQAYSGSALDTYLNTTFYNTLSSTAKAAIVSQSITQYKYSSGSVSDSHRSYATYSSKAVYESDLSRYIYALDVEDIEMYFGGTGGSASANTQGTFAIADLMTLFYKSTGTISGKYFWLRSASADYTSYAWVVGGDYGRVNYHDVSNAYAVRPAFVIDLSKISWSKSS